MSINTGERQQSEMETLFVAATAVIVFVFAALAVFLWNTMAFLKLGSFDLRFLMVIENFE